MIIAASLEEIPLQVALFLSILWMSACSDYDAKRAFGISAADPGAVPGASTKFISSGRCFWGRIRIDARGKEMFGVRHGTTDIGPF